MAEEAQSVLDEKIEWSKEDQIEEGPEVRGDQSVKDAPGNPRLTVGEQLDDFFANLCYVYGNPKATREEKNAPFENNHTIAAFVQLYETDKIGLEGVISDIAKITHLPKESLRKMVEEEANQAAIRRLENAKYAKKDKEEPEQSEFGKKVVAKANELAEEGKIYDYIYNVWQKRVKGNALLGKCTIISRGVQSCTNSKGLHIYAHGRWGQGKSHGMDVAADLVPPGVILDSDISPKVLYYMQDKNLLLPTTTILVDDIEINSPLAGLFKKVTTKFQKGAAHDVVMDGEVLKLQLPPRCSIWTNSVEFQGDEQVRDRFLDIPIEEGQTKEIIEYMKQVDQEPLDEEERAFEVAVC